MNSLKKATYTTPLTLLIAVLLTGCSDDTTFQISGTATFQGNSIPIGEVRLTPNSKQGNHGPAVLAMIKNGRYQTSHKKGVQGGPYVLRVTGYGSAPTSKDPTAPRMGRPLFPVQQLFVELPMEDFEYDIKIE